MEITVADNTSQDDQVVQDLCKATDNVGKWQKSLGTCSKIMIGFAGLGVVCAGFHVLMGPPPAPREFGNDAVPVPRHERTFNKHQTRKEFMEQENEVPTYLDDIMVEEPIGVYSPIDSIMPLYEETDVEDESEIEIEPIFRNLAASKDSGFYAVKKREFRDKRWQKRSHEYKANEEGMPHPPKGGKFEKLLHKGAVVALILNILVLSASIMGYKASKAEGLEKI